MRSEVWSSDSTVYECRWNYAHKGAEECYAEEHCMSVLYIGETTGEVHFLLSAYLCFPGLVKRACITAGLRKPMNTGLRNTYTIVIGTQNMHNTEESAEDWMQPGGPPTPRTSVPTTAHPPTSLGPLLMSPDFGDRLKARELLMLLGI